MTAPSAQAMAPSEMPRAGTFHSRRAAVTASTSAGAVHRRIAGAVRSTGRRGTRHWSRKVTRTKVPVHNVAIFAARIAASSVRRSAVQGCSEKCLRSTAATESVRASTTSNRISSPATAAPANRCVATNRPRAAAGGRRARRSTARSCVSGAASSATSDASDVPAISTTAGSPGPPSSATSSASQPTAVPGGEQQGGRRRQTARSW